MMDGLLVTDDLFCIIASTRTDSVGRLAVTMTDWQLRYLHERLTKYLDEHPGEQVPA